MTSGHETVYVIRRDLRDSEWVVSYHRDNDATYGRCRALGEMTIEQAETEFRRVAAVYGWTGTLRARVDAGSWRELGAL